MQRDLAVAPTGCAAALVKAKTTARGLKIPCGSKLHGNITNNIPGRNAEEITHWNKSIQQLFFLFNDEHSMEPRATFGWKESRCSVARRSASVKKIDSQVACRSFGGIPFVSSSGDVHQLPPCFGKMHFDNRLLNGANADSAGYHVVQSFLESRDPVEEFSVVTVMDQSIRQNNGPLKRMINEMRKGTVSHLTAGILLGRKLDRLPTAE